jgi:hypothetical protein
MTNSKIDSIYYKLPSTTIWNGNILKKSINTNSTSKIYLPDSFINVNGNMVDLQFQSSDGEIYLKNDITLFHEGVVNLSMNDEALGVYIRNLTYENITGIFYKSPSATEWSANTIISPLTNNYNRKLIFSGSTLPNRLDLRIQSDQGYIYERINAEIMTNGIIPFDSDNMISGLIKIKVVNNVRNYFNEKTSIFRLQVGSQYYTIWSGNLSYGKELTLMINKIYLTSNNNTTFTIYYYRYGNSETNFRVTEKIYSNVKIYFRN